ncbi:NADP-dependent oxidoreductase [Cnuibacter physcomitrellae]|uniref:quinone oxidoreductase family protein n=1 Tax=Cnuibacter physcomitrellae TaxID=1619308 RepID=UPI002175CE1D|nr:NADP-dependent oxidoreductase [Cnuibacter physcomitrellae]MCS5495796.1 NADP-dependent oxidoreductase [Cnuibacter physcomitrellae]
MSLAVVARSFGSPEVLEVVEVDPPVAGPGQVVIEVRAAGVNPADAKLVAGTFGADPSMLPIRPGSEVAGVVTAVGPDAVDGVLQGGDGPVSVGDEVIAYRVSGGYASAVAVRASSVFAKPPALDWAAASGLLLAGATAWHLVEATGVGPDDVVIVFGASGGVGAMAVQLAALRGARVLGVASAANADYVASLGATPVARGAGLESRLRAALSASAGAADAAAAGGAAGAAGAGAAGGAGGAADAAGDGAPATVALDTVGGAEGLDAAVALVADRSRIATIADFERGAALGIRLLGSGPGADPGAALRNAARAPLVALAAQGALTVTVAATYPLASAADALTLPHAPGKVALLP